MPGNGRQKPGRFRLNIPAAQHHIGQPQRRAIDQHHPIGAAQSPRHIARRLMRDPIPTAVGDMLRNPRPHFLIPNFRRCDIMPGQARRMGQLFSQPRFARPRAADDQREFRERLG